MADLATIPDVEDEYRPLRGNENDAAAAWIAGAQAQLRSEILGLDAWVEADPEHAIAIRSRIVMSVLRRLDGSYTSSWAFTRDEIDRLIDTVAGNVNGGLPMGSFPPVVCYPVY